MGLKIHEFTLHKFIPLVQLIETGRKLCMRFFIIVIFVFLK